MKIIHTGDDAAFPDLMVLELTRRNLTALLEKLDDPHSARTLLNPGPLPLVLAVRAVEDDEHYADRAPGVIYTNGVLS